MLRIPWTAHRTNVSILRELKIQLNERLLSSIQRRMLKFFGHVLRRDGMEKLTIQGKVEGKRSRGRSPVRYIDHIKNLTHMSVAEIMTTAEDREAWWRLTISTSWASRCSASNNNLREIYVLYRIHFSKQ